jgi:hypothetical protein
MAGLLAGAYPRWDRWSGLAESQTASVMGSLGKEFRLEREEVGGRPLIVNPQASKGVLVTHPLAMKSEAWLGPDTALLLVAAEERFGGRIALTDPFQMARNPMATFMGLMPDED